MRIRTAVGQPRMNGLGSLVRARCHDDRPRAAGAPGIDRETGDVARVPDPGLRDRCDGCGRALDGAVYQLHGPAGPHLACRGCALRYRPLLRRSSLIALAVGSVLVAINQGDLLLAGRTEPALLWKVPLTYLVPFVVATWGGLLNSRAR